MVPHAARRDALPSAELTIGVVCIHVYGSLASSDVFAHAAQPLSALASEHSLRGLHIAVRSHTSTDGTVVRVDVLADRSGDLFILRRTRANVFDALDAAIATLRERLVAPHTHPVANDNALN